MATKEGPLTMEELEENIAERKSKIELWKKSKASYQQWQREAEEEKRRLQTQLSRTTNQKERRELDMMIAEKEEEIKRRKEGVQHQEELINMIESDIQGYMEVKESKRLLEEALHAGYVRVRIIICLLLGMSGVGKTCLKSLLLDKPPPLVRHSTPCAEKPTRAHIRSVTGLKVKAEDGGWKEINEERLSTLIARTIHAFELITNEPISLDTVQQLRKLIRFEETSRDSATSSQPSDTSPVTQQPQDQSAESKEAVKVVLDKLVTRITEFRKETEDGDRDQLKEVFGSEWVYFTDSGGQPQFHEILPLFIHNTSATLFVIRLSESLDSCPLVEYYKDGKPVGQAHRSTLTTIDTLRCLIRSMQSRPAKGRLPKIIVVGTHKDLMEECSEKLEVKNKRLVDLLREYSDSLVFFSQDLQQLIFPVDTAHPGKEEKKIAEDIRGHIEHTVVEEVKVPIWWYILELLLRQLAKQLGREVLSRSECLEIAHALNFRDDAFGTAMSFFHDLNVFHYYPDTLPEVVFVNSQVPLDKLTELVDFSFSLRQGTGDQASCSPRSSMEGKWMRFRDQGILTVKFLEKFQQHYVKGLFTPPSFLKLLNKLLIAAPLTDDDTQPASLPDHFMPALLDMLPNSELEKHRVLSSAAAPLLIRFPEGWPRAGVFCCLVIHLMNVCGWKVTFASGNVILVARNCIKFRLPKSPCYVTLIDAFSYIEVHVNAPASVCLELCPMIQNFIVSGIEAACTKLHYSNDHPSLAIFCPHTTDDETPSTEHTSSTEQTPSSKVVKPKPHAAEVIAHHCCWTCTESELFGEFDAKHKIWLATQVPQIHGPVIAPAYQTPTGAAAKPTAPSSDLNDRLVSMALTNLLDWHKLGLLLGIKKIKLDRIRLDFDKYGSERQRDEMVSFWLRSDRDASWEKLCIALENIDHNTIAEHIRTRYSTK